MKKVYVKPDFKVVDLRFEERVSSNVCYDNKNSGQRCPLLSGINPLVGQGSAP